jgi:hypothetical protein
MSVFCDPSWPYHVAKKCGSPGQKLEPSSSLLDVEPEFEPGLEPEDPELGRGAEAGGSAGSAGRTLHFYQDGNSRFVLFA